MRKGPTTGPTISFLAVVDNHIVSSYPEFLACLSELRDFPYHNARNSLLKKIEQDSLCLISNANIWDFLAISSLIRAVTSLLWHFELTTYCNLRVQVSQSACKMKIEFPVNKYFKNITFTSDMGSYYFFHRQNERL